MHISPIANESARASVMTRFVFPSLISLRVSTHYSLLRLFADLVTDSLTEFAYDADLAGLNYNFAAHNMGVFATLSGYNDKLHVLAKDVFEKARNLTVNPERLNAKKQEVKRDWENFFLEQPFRISDYFARYVLTERQWTLKEKLEEISSTSFIVGRLAIVANDILGITPRELQAFIGRLLSQVHLRTLVVGNLYKDVSALKSISVFPSDLLSRRPFVW